MVQLTAKPKSKTCTDQPVIDDAFSAIAVADDMLNRLLEWDELWHADGLLQTCTIRLNTRLTRSIGLCRPSRNLIDLNKLLLLEENRELLFETLCHESAHMVVHTRLGRDSKPHGHEWQILMRSAGFVARAHIPSDEIAGTVTPARRARYEYEHTCTGCGATMLSRRTSYRWRCATCVAKGRDGYLDVTRRAL